MMGLYEQGDLIDLNFDPSVGHEPAKRRPAVVLSVGRFNNVLSSLTVVCPITSTNNGHPLHIPIASGNVVAGCVCIEQMRAMDLSKRSCTHRESMLDAKTMSRVLEAVGATFGI